MDIHPYDYPKNSYTLKQKAEWELLLDTYNAIEFGFDRYRFATLGESVAISDALKDVKRMEVEWDREWRTRDSVRKYSGAPRLSGMPVNAQLYLHSVMKGLKK